MKITKEQLTKELLHAQAGGAIAGFDVMTKYRCVKCEKVDVWYQSNTPHYCEDCANIISERIIKSLNNG